MRKTQWYGALALVALAIAAPAGAQLTPGEGYVDVGLILRLDVDTTNFTYTARLSLEDPQNLTLGLQGIQFFITGDGIDILTTNLQLPVLTETAPSGTFQKGFYELRSPPGVPAPYASQPLENKFNPNTGLNNIIEGVGEVFVDESGTVTAGTDPMAADVVVATGTWGFSAGSNHGSIEIFSDPDLNVLLPATLPAPVEFGQPGGGFAANSAARVENHLVYVGQGNTESSVNFSGLVEVLSGASATIDTLNIAGDLIVDGSLTSTTINVTGDADIGASGEVFADGVTMPNDVLIDGALTIYADSGLDSALGDVFMGSGGQLVLAPKPLPAPSATVESIAVPEPATVGLLLLGAAALRRRR